VRVFARLNFAKQILADDSLPAGRQVSRGTRKIKMEEAKQND